MNSTNFFLWIGISSSAGPENSFKLTGRKIIKWVMHDRQLNGRDLYCWLKIMKLNPLCLLFC